MNTEASYNVTKSEWPGYWDLTVYAENGHVTLQANLRTEEVEENIALLREAGAVSRAEHIMKGVLL
jgi:osmotically-inducible protein OsmY